MKPHSFSKSLLSCSLFVATLALTATASIARVQVMGPYAHELQKIEIKSGSAAGLLVDLHEVASCKGDANYRQTRLDKSTWFLEVHPFNDPNANCPANSTTRVGTLIDLQTAPTSANVVVWVSDLRSQTYDVPVIGIDSLGNDIILQVQRAKTAAALVKILDYDSDALAVSVAFPSGQVKTQNYRLPFQYMPDGEQFETENRVLLLGGTATSPNPFAIAAGDVGDFRSLSLTIELPAGVSAKQLQISAK